MLCAGSHVMFPGLFTLLLRESVRLLRRRSVSGASIDGSDAAQSLDEAARVHLYHTFRRLMDQVVEGDFSPNIVYRGEEPVEYGVFAFQQYGPEYHSVEF